MDKHHFKVSWILIIAILMVSLSSGCLYYNTFYNAKQAFKEAEKSRKSTGIGNNAGYQKAIDKSLKILENYPKSKYYDDALFVTGVSYFYLKQYQKAERRLNELVINYPNSGYFKEAKLYLARAKLMNRDTKEAISLFDEIFNGKFDREYRADVALELGKYYTEEKNFPEAKQFLSSVSDSLGNDKQKKEALKFLINVNFQNSSFGEALDNCTKFLNMKPDKNDKYFALTTSAQCSFRLLRVNKGLTYLNTLIKDPIYFDSLYVLKLMVAQGYEYSGDLALAEEMYEEVAINGQKSNLIAKAYCNLGFIYQYDYDDLTKAKSFYDKAADADRGCEAGREAIQRSSDIAKMEALSKASLDEIAASKEQSQIPNSSQPVKSDSSRTANDSTSAQQSQTDSTKNNNSKQSDSAALAAQAKTKADNAASTIFQLAELYWFQLNKPDSAISELKFLLVHFPTSKIATRALLSLSQMYREYLLDSVGADSILNYMINTYQRSDDLPEALIALNLIGTPADTGYAELYYHKAEDFLIDSGNVDSSLYYYQYVVDNFPDSKYNQRARFNIIWVKENYRSPGDSSIVFAYQQFVDSFPQSPLTRDIRQRLTVQKEEEKPVKTAMDSMRDSLYALTDSTGKVDSSVMAFNQVDDTGSTYIDPLQAVYIGPKNERLVLLDIDPQKIDVDFEYPSEALDIKADEFYMYYQILLDISGRVVDYILKIPSENAELNRRLNETITSMTFDPLEVSKILAQKAESMILPEDQADPRGRWYVYKYTVKKPGSSR